MREIGIRTYTHERKVVKKKVTVSYVLEQGCEGEGYCVLCIHTPELHTENVAGVKNEFFQKICGEGGKSSPRGPPRSPPS